MRIHLIGNRYDFIVEGGPRFQNGTACDTMGDDYHTTWHWFQGEGKVVDKHMGRETAFIIETRHSETGYDKELTLEVFILGRLVGAHRGRVLPGRESIFADFIAERMLAEIAAAGGKNPIPRCQFAPKEYKEERELWQELIARGIVADENGQMGLPGLSVSSVSA